MANFIFCDECSAKIKDGLDKCPRCSKRVEDIRPISELLTAKPDKKRSFSLIIKIIAIFMAAVITVVALLLVLSKYLGFGSVLNIFSKNKLKNYSQADIDDTIDRINVSAILSVADYYCDGIGQTYYFDNDSDGEKELIFESFSSTYKGGQAILSFDSLKSKDASLYTTFSNLYEEPLNYGTLLSTYCNAKNPTEIVEKYNSYLSELEDCQYYMIEEDIDSDGENEYAFFLKNYTRRYLNSLADTGSTGKNIKKFFDSKKNNGMTVIYADYSSDGIVFHTFFLPSDESIGEVEERHKMGDRVIGYSEGILSLTSIEGYGATEATYFCANIYETYSEDSFDTSDFIYKYLSFLRTDDDNRKIYIKYADLTDNEAREVILVDCYKGNNTAYVYTVKNGRLVNLYTQDLYSVGAVYIVNENGKSKLLNYVQQPFNGGCNYEYWFTEFNENCGTENQSGAAITLYNNQIPTAEQNAFFNNLNSYLDSGSVCTDRYELTGYAVMPTSESDHRETGNGKYLYISDCDTSKKGTVNVKEDSWLNFRKGPSTKHQLILLNSKDKKSYVKQMRGSSVTIIDTVNTGDKENPVWVKIQIKYADKTLIGYSSHTFIDTSQVKHISVGESFKIGISTNDTGVKWSVNDSSVLKINPATGEVTGLSKGLVLVTVKSDSSLTDSCLIEVD